MMVGERDICGTKSHSQHVIGYKYMFEMGFPCGSDGKESACNAGDLDSIPGLGSSLEKGMAVLQYSCSENPHG